MSKKQRLYEPIITEIFKRNHQPGASSVPFTRGQIVEVAQALGIDLPKNPGDVVYAFKFRTDLPAEIKGCAPGNKEWIIMGRGRSKYAFELRSASRIHPDSMLEVIKIPDATPGMVGRYALNDEQALLARLRYNRLIDVFTGVAAYSLQNHLRTSVSGIGQIETDELYVGLDDAGRQFVFPVQAKGGSDELGVVQAEQDIALCRSKFPGLICRPIAAQFMDGDVIALFELALRDNEVKKLRERHYRLVPSDELSREDLERYQLGG